jgi:PIN domain nuclease of toxin-antitoxin system
VILLDTHALIWLAQSPEKLSSKASDAIRAARGGGGIAVSAMTLWELAWLATNRRLNIFGTVAAFLEEITHRTAIRPITAEIALLASQFPSTYPKDPCDRLIGATALSEGIALVTKDHDIRNCQQIKTIW